MRKRIIVSVVCLCALGASSVANSALAQPVADESVRRVPPAPTTCVTPGVPSQVTGVDSSQPGRMQPFDTDKGSVAVPSRTWYGYYTLGVDAISALALLGGAAAGSPPLLGLGVGGYALGAPLVHATQGRAGAAVGSLGMRVALPVTGAIIGAQFKKGCSRSTASSSNDDWGNFCIDFGYVAEGFVVGTLAAIVLDASLLAWRSNEAGGVKGTSLHVSPMLDPMSRSSGISVGGDL